MEEQFCKHLQDIREVKLPAEDEHVCEECIKHNGRWVHLRTCQTCGATLCCDASPARHMTAHYHATGHPVVASAEPGEQWLWCYPDQQFADY
ncbi:UBP-type zinc finger domain-containing protein [uncultured Chitinophaga sp.]|uniref:UBP-type zinc finger domain-containing protein n=1 Tax=uncultured Chitinophaga sp. TaxID=339340 RepID=UPI0026377856|nr:UBP-type zinc finger domain-containing protein [uncultured Chitinophaga sp.]